MNVGFHIIFGVLTVLFFVWSYIKERKIYQLLFAIWAASTFLIYLSAAHIYQICLGIFELILCGVSLTFLYLEKRRKR